MSDGIPSESLSAEITHTCWEMGQLYEAILTLNEGYQLKPTEVSTNYLMGMFLAEL